MSFKVSKQGANKNKQFVPVNNNFIRYKDVLFSKESFVYFFLLVLSFMWILNHFNDARNDAKTGYISEQKIKNQFLVDKIQDNLNFSSQWIDESQWKISTDNLSVSGSDFKIVSNKIYIKQNGNLYERDVGSFIQSVLINHPLNYKISTSRGDVLSSDWLEQDQWYQAVGGLYQFVDSNFYLMTDHKLTNHSGDIYPLQIQTYSSAVKQAIDQHDIEFYSSIFVFILLSVIVTVLLLNKQEMNAHRQFLYTVSNTISEGQITINSDGLIENVNKAAQFELEFMEEELKGKPFSSLFNADFDIKRNENPVEMEINMARKSGGFFIAEIVISPIFMSGERVGSVAVFRNITERIESQERVNRLAFYDTLTALPNRRMLNKFLKECMIETERSHQWSALFFMDMDNFKILNDTRGHEAGDIMLKEVARRLSHTARGDDVAARLGGDEFVILMPKIGLDEETAKENATKLGNRLLAELGKPYDINGASHNSTPSIGVTLFLGAQLDMEEIFRRSDMAMYEAKAGGKNNVKFFDQRLLEKITRRNDLDTELKGAIERGELFCMLQPQVMHSGKLYGAELLMRWRNHNLGLVSPGEFIPVAEETGMIVEMGYWILEEACKIISSWKERDLPYNEWVLSINVSPLQLREMDFVDRVKNIIMRYDLNGAKLKMEITETGTIKNINTVIDKINELKKLGISFSMDDFGTGYSSMTYLRQLPIDQIKIDQSFVKGMTEAAGSDDIVIVKTIIDMARNLSLYIVAEGVETEEQLAILHHEGCDIYQGYLFGRPQSLDEFEREWGEMDIVEGEVL